MTRQHKSRYYPSEHLRSLQAQIDEVWGVVEKIIGPHNPADPFLAYQREGVGRGVTCGSVLEHSEAIQAQHVDHARVNKIIDRDATAHAATAEVANTLKPDAFQVKHLNYGWYQVVDADDKPIHEGKLRKGPAVEAWKAAMEGV